MQPGFHLNCDLILYLDLVKNNMNHFTRISAGMLLLAAVLSSCGMQECISGSGNQVSEDRQTGDFTKVDVSGSVKVILHQDSHNSLRIVADDNIQEQIETSVHGNTLRIKMRNNICEAGPVTAYIYSKKYEGLGASGVVEIASNGKLNVNDFTLNLSGSSKVALELDAASVKTSSSGASEIFLKGQAGSHELHLSGSSSVQAPDFVVGRYKIESSGSSNSKINVLNELDISSSGSSDVEYRGNPSRISQDKSGSSSLRKVD